MKFYHAVAIVMISVSSMIIGTTPEEQPVDEEAVYLSISKKNQAAPTYNDHSGSTGYANRGVVGGGGYGGGSYHQPASVGYGVQRQYGYQGPVTAKKVSGYSPKKSCCEFDNIEANADCRRRNGQSKKRGRYYVCDIHIPDNDDDCFPFDNASLKGFRYDENGNVIYTLNFMGDHGSIQAIGTGGANDNTPSSTNDELQLGIAGGTEEKKCACGDITIDVSNFLPDDDDFTWDFEIEGKLCLDKSH